MIGVLPASFEFMDRQISMVIPLRFNRNDVKLGNFSYQGIAKLRPGATIGQANADLARMLPLVLERFAPPAGFSVRLFAEAGIAPKLRTMKQDLLGDVAGTLWVLMGTVGLVLLIACANIANLLLVRADGRQQELAIRAALGAGWARVARELLLESMLLGLAGGAVGTMLAAGGIRLLAASELSNLPRISSITVDASVVGFALVVSLLAGFFFGLIPVLKYVSPQLGTVLRGGGRALSQSRERHRARNVLVVVQVALALVLLVSSGLMIRSFTALRNVQPGFSGAEKIQSLRTAIPNTLVKEPERILAMQQEILRKLSEVPQVETVAFVSNIPMTGSSNDPVYAEDHPMAEGKLPPIRRFKYISPGYVRAIGTTLVAGREFTWADNYGRARVAIVSENMAREWWNSPQLALGKRIRVNTKDDWREIVGVIADLRDNGVDQKAPAVVYWPVLMSNFEGDPTFIASSVSWIVRSSRAGSTAFVEDLRRAVWSVNANLPLAGVRTLQNVLDRSLRRTTFTMFLLAVSGTMALILGVIGIYGVISYSVAQRTREIGIRLALGSPGDKVTMMFIRYGFTLSGIGAVIGLGGAFALSRWMEKLLFGISAVDPTTYVLVPAILIAAAMLASYIPARRATRVDPTLAIRSE